MHKAKLKSSTPTIGNTVLPAVNFAVYIDGDYKQTVSVKADSEEQAERRLIDAGMKVLPDKKFVHQGQGVVFVASTIEDAKNNRDEKILHWAKSLQNKPLSISQLVENANWLLNNVK